MQNIDDLRNWTSGITGPIAAIWNTVAMPLEEHVAITMAGHWFLPSVEIPMWSSKQEKTGAETMPADNPAVVDGILKGMTPEAWADLDTIGCLCLRTNNLPDSFLGKSPRYRLPKVPESIPLSPLQWIKKADGTLDDMPTVDIHGDPELWRDAGTRWPQMLMFTRLAEHLTDPAWISFLENNEAKYTRLLTPYTTAGWKAWLTPEQIEQNATHGSVRMADWVRANPNTKPMDFFHIYWEKRQALYHCLLNSFDDNLPANWADAKFTNSCYVGMSDQGVPTPDADFPEWGHVPEQAVVAGEASIYHTPARSLVDFTGPEHLRVLNNIPVWENAGTKRYLAVSMYAGGVTTGAFAGLHEPITPALWTGYCQWLLWNIHEKRVPTMLRYWNSSTIPANTKLLSPTHDEELTELGYPDLVDVTHGDYINAMIAACDQINSHPTLRKYWVDGDQVLAPGTMPTGAPFPLNVSGTFPRPGEPDNRWRFLECSANPPRATWVFRDGVAKPVLKVWAVAKRIGDEFLLYVWTPCKDVGVITVYVPGMGPGGADLPIDMALDEAGGHYEYGHWQPGEDPNPRLDGLRERPEMATMDDTRWLVGLVDVFKGGAPLPSTPPKFVVEPVEV